MGDPSQPSDLIAEGDSNFVTTTRGDLLTRNATQNIRLGIGTDNPLSGAAGARVNIYFEDQTTYDSTTNRANGLIINNQASGGYSSLELAQRTTSGNTYGSAIINAVDPQDGNTYGADLTFQTRATGSGNYGERMRITATGRLLVAHATGLAPGSFSSKVSIEDTNSAASISITRNSANSGAPVLLFGKSRGTSVGSNTIVQDDDQLGEIRFYGADGTDRGSFAALIKADVDGTPGSNDMPGRLIFSTTGDGSVSPTEAMRITSTGDLCVGTTTAVGKAEIATSASEIGLTVSNDTHDSYLQILAIY